MLKHLFASKKRHFDTGCNVFQKNFSLCLPSMWFVVFLLQEGGKQQKAFMGLQNECN